VILSRSVPFLFILFRCTFLYSIYEFTIRWSRTKYSVRHKLWRRSWSAFIQGLASRRKS
jgi:hypothetical protein